MLKHTEEDYDHLRRRYESAIVANKFIEEMLERVRGDLEFVTNERDRLAAQVEAEQATMRDVIMDNATSGNSAVDEVMRLREILTKNGIEIGG